VQVFVLLPPLEHAPDQIASRPLLTVSVIAAPVANEAEPLRIAGGELNDHAARTSRAFNEACHHDADRKACDA
jgi:hypothetical protein